jgi:hypothetical protein
MKKILLLFVCSSYLLLCSFSQKDISTNTTKGSEIVFQEKEPKPGDEVKVVVKLTGEGGIEARVVNVKIKCLECLQCASVYAYAQAGDGTWYYIHTDYSSSTGWSGYAVDGPRC